MNMLRDVEQSSLTELFRRAVSVYNLVLTNDFEGGTAYTVVDGATTLIPIRPEIEHNDELGTKFSVNIGAPVRTAIDTICDFESIDERVCADRAIGVYATMLTARYAGGEVVIEESGGRKMQVELIP